MKIETASKPIDLKTATFVAETSSIALPYTKLLNDEVTEGKLGFMVSNEAMHHRTYPALVDNAITGSLISIGFDRGLDTLIAVPQLKEAYLLDYNRQTSLTSLALLIVAEMHVRQHGAFKNVEDFITYFSQNKIETTLSMLQSEFSTEDLSLIKDAFLTRCKIDYDDNSDGVLYLEIYLKFKHQQQMYNSWLSTPENLNEILRRRIEGQIQLAHGDATGGTAMQAIVDDLYLKKNVVSIFDTSNIDFYFDQNARSAFHNACAIVESNSDSHRLPIDPKNTIFLYTYNSSSGPIIPKSLSREFPELSRTLNGNIWGYYLIRAEPLRKLVAQNPHESEVVSMVLQAHAVKLRGETYPEVAIDKNDIFLFGEFKTPAEIPVSEWGINQLALEKDAYKAIATKNGQALFAYEEKILATIIEKRVRLGFDTESISNACLNQSLLISQSLELSPELAQAALTYAQFALAANAGSQNSLNITSILKTASLFQNAGQSDAALKIIDLVGIAPYIGWKPDLTLRVPVLKPDLKESTLLQDPEKALSHKKGNPLSTNDSRLIQTVLSRENLNNFDHARFSSSCLDQAGHLVRILTGALLKLGESYYQYKPSAQEATAAVQYVSFALQANSNTLIDFNKLGSIVAGLRYAGYDQAALEILELLNSAQVVKIN